MPQCATCAKFTRQTHHCSFYNKTIALADIHKQISCDGYPNYAKRKWLLNASHKEQDPQVMAMLTYQILGDKTQ